MRQLLLLLLTLVPLLLHAQTGWEGDIDEFVIKDGVASHRNNSKSGTATIYKQFSATETSGSFTCSLGFVFEDLPTSSNSFEVTLFSQRESNFIYYYKLIPLQINKGLNVVLDTYEKRSSGEIRRISRKYLERWPGKGGLLFWSKLFFEMDYDPVKGVSFSLFSPIEGLRQGEWISVRSVAPHWQMSLETKFTSKKKLLYNYILPAIQHRDTDGSSGDIHILSEEVDPIGRVILNLTGPVSTVSAKVSCAGFQPTIEPGNSPSQVIIHLGVPFEAGRRYDFLITNLVNKLGQYVSIPCTINIQSVGEGSSTDIPEGLFFTEIMASPPADGPLQGIKYIELFNQTGVPQNLALYTLLYGKTKYELPSVTLVNGAYAVLYLESDPYPTRVATLVPMSRFPAMSSSFTLTLQDSAGREVDKVHFNTQLYGEGSAKSGASVERVAYYPDLWRRSNHPSGGTPGLPTSMKPYSRVAVGSVVINELLLTPPTTGEKYIELYNPTSETINLANLYLSYSNKEENINSSSWLLVKDDHLLQPHSYVVLTPYPDALARLYPVSDPTTFVERIDFPSISTTYSEVSLHAHATNEVVDRAIYRRQWLGDQSSDRTGFSLERLSPTLDGTQKSSWHRAEANGQQKETGGTPGVANSHHRTTTDPPCETLMGWPDDPKLSYELIEPMLYSFSEFATLTLYTTLGDILMQVKGAEILPILNAFRVAQLPIPPILVVVDLQFHHPEKDPTLVTYRGIWLHACE